MRIAVFGTGGVGGYFGGRLAKSGQEVIFIARGAHLQAIKTSGLRVESIKGDFHLDPVKATDSPSEIGAVDAVLVAVKAWQVPEVALSIAPMMDSNTVVVPLENGVEAPDQLAAVLGKQALVGGLCKIISYVAAPGHIKHTGVEPVVAFGELDNSKSARVEKLRHAFAKAEVSVEMPADIRVAMWEKFLFIASTSGLGAITRAPIGIVRSLAGTRELLEKSMQEIFQVACARNVELSEDTIQRALTYVDGIHPTGTTSMQRDILEGRPSELEYQTGTIVRFGEQLRVDTPVNRFIYDCLLPMERKARGLLQY